MLRGPALPRRSSVNQVAAQSKALFRMIGTIVGAVAIMVLTACFPQNRIGLLMGLAALIPWLSFSELATVASGRSAPKAAVHNFTSTGINRHGLD
jgi:hypothetical protein